MPTPKQILLLVAICVVSFGAGLYFGPKEVETKEVERVVYRDRIIKDVNSDIVTRTKEITMPDGSVVRDTITEDRSRTRTDTKRDEVKETIKERKETRRPDWRVGAIYKSAIQNHQEVGYGVLVERRIVGEVNVGVLGLSDRSFGLVISVGF